MSPLIPAGAACGSSRDAISDVESKSGELVFGATVGFFELKMKSQLTLTELIAGLARWIMSHSSDDVKHLLGAVLNVHTLMSGHAKENDGGTACVGLLITLRSRPNMRMGLRQADEVGRHFAALQSTHAKHEAETLVNCNLAAHVVRKTRQWYRRRSQARPSPAPSPMIRRIASSLADLGLCYVKDHSSPSAATPHGLLNLTRSLDSRSSMYDFSSNDAQKTFTSAEQPEFNV
ncbi:hypothetical protein BC835DRAFT_1303849 [Cytidiella melzeri]|nr:hypothetical protein BC835DRAFT_1303849 [Cytidiella melzeri]